MSRSLKIDLSIENEEDIQEKYGKPSKHSN